MSEINRYQLVHMIAKRAKRKDINARNPLKENEYIPTINKIIERRNTVKESYDEIMQAIKEGKITPYHLDPFWDEEKKK